MVCRVVWVMLGKELDRRVEYIVGGLEEDPEE